MAESYDVVIVGAGHNGLVAATYLARAGKKTLVVERRDVAGGIVATEEFAPGYKASIGPDLVGLLRPQIVQDLELERHGLEIINLDPTVFLPLPDGGHFTLWRDRDKTLQEIERYSKADAAAYPKFVELIQSVTGFLRKAFAKPTPRPESHDTRDLLDLLQLAWKMRRLGTKNMQQTLRIIPTSVADLLNEWFESQPLKACLASQGIVGVSMGPRSFGTAVIFLYHQFEEKGWPWSSWGFPRGGMGSVSAALLRAAESQGVTIRTQANVSRIRIEDGRANGVVLEGGEEIAARRVVSNADPGTTFMKLVEPEHLEVEFLKKIERIRYRGVTAKLNLALSELPDFTCLPGKDPAAHHRGVIQIGPNLDYLEKAYDHVKYRRPSERPFLQAIIPSLLDPSLAPDGKHVMSVIMQYAPYRIDDGDWHTRRDSLADTIIDTLSEYAPNLKGAVLERQILTPLDYQEVYGQPEGSFHHGEISIDQLYIMRPTDGWSRYRTPIASLYLCGSGTHPGGGVSGACGLSASRRILEDWS
jgi:phytoene dehydrogenase-like protein